MKPPPDNVHYGYPDLRFSHLVYYVVRDSANSHGLIQLDEWLAYIDRSPDLVLDEVYPQYNINHEYQETWQEIGRAKWASADGPVHFHFRPSGVGFVGIHRPVDLKTEMQRERLLKALPEHPTLEEWVGVVEQSRYMVLAQGQDEPKEAWWVGKSGQKKVLFAWRPPALWMYQMPAEQFYDEDAKPDPARKTRCEALARDLGGMVVQEP